MKWKGSNNACLAVVACLLSGCQAPPSQDRVCFHQQCYLVEVVSHGAELEKGLQQRTALPRDHGMLFIFPTSRVQPFWMKDTLIPLDIIWLDYAQRAVHIEENVPPCEQDPCPSYVPVGKALYVLEVNAGEAKRMGLQKGDRAEFHLRLR